jgi:PAS domain S-box-containing protein
MALFRKSTAAGERKPRKSLPSRIVPHSGVSNLSAGRIALGYAVIAIIWIAFSDAVVTHFKLPPAVATIKGTLFVFATASLLYFTIRRLVQAVQLTSQERDETAAYLAEAQTLSHTGSWYLDVVHNRLSWSDEVFRIFGIQFGTPLTYETFLAAVHTDDRAFVDQAWKKALHGAAYDIEHRILVGREVRWVREKAQLEFDASGRATKGMGTVQDITERKRAEEVLRERADLLNLTHDAVFVMGMKGVIKYWNRGAEEQYGWNAEQAVGKVVHDMLKTVFPSPLDEIKAKLTRTGRWEGELRHTRKDGTQLVVASRWALQRDEQGAPVAILETNNDITERKRTEEVLQQSEAYLSEGQRLTHTGSWAFDVASDRYIYISEECYRIFGVDPLAEWPAREVVFRKIHAEDADTVNRGFEKSVHERVETSNEFRIVLPDGAVKTVHVTRHPVLNSAGDVVKLTGIAVDITERRQAEEALREGETRFRTFVDHAADAFFVHDEEQHRVLDVNRQACETLGYSREELIGMVPHDFDPDVDAPLLQRIDERIEAGGVFTFETRHRRKDGTMFPVEVRIRPFRHGGRRLHLALARDISERKRAEDERRQSAERFRAIADYTYDWENWVGVDGKLLWVNPAVERITGYSVDECMAMPDFPIPIIAEADQQSVASEMREAVQGSSRNDFEFRVRRKDGRLAWVAASWQPIYDSRGARLGYRSSMRDIAERKRVEEALRESETRFRTFVDHAGDALFVLDFEQGTIADMNGEACKSLGYTLEELVGKTPLVFHLDSERAQMESVAEWAAAGETVFDRHWHRRKDGSLFPVEVNTSSFCHGGRRFMLKVARDISDRLRAEEQRERLRELEEELAHINRVSMMGELAASIAHEVNQPLSGIISNGSACLRWLAGGAPNLDEARENARRIVRDGKRAAEVIARIRSLAQKAAAPMGRLDLNETIRDVLPLVGDETKRKSVTVRTQFADALSPVSGDRVQLQQVVLNLFMNAMEAMSRVGEQARELVITTRNIDPDQVEVTVEDSGVGLDPSTMARIFDPFYTTKPDGMGLGLSVCRSIIRTHGGRLWATAKDGPGTVFHFVLPKYDAAEAHAEVAGV